MNALLNQEALTATILVREHAGRVLVRWVGTWADRCALDQDFRDVFQRHYERCWSRRHRAWSLPLSQCERVINWARGTRVRVVWLDEATP